MSIRLKQRTAPREAERRWTAGKQADNHAASRDAPRCHHYSNVPPATSRETAKTGRGDAWRSLRHASPCGTPLRHRSGKTLSTVGAASSIDAHTSRSVLRSMNHARNIRSSVGAT